MVERPESAPGDVVLDVFAVDETVVSIELDDVTHAVVNVTESDVAHIVLSELQKSVVCIVEVVKVDVVVKSVVQLKLYSTTVIYS